MVAQAAPPQGGPARHCGHPGGGAIVGRRSARSPPLALFTKRYHEPGTLPGTLVETVYEAPLRIMLVEFTDESFEERIIDSPTECVSPEECHE